MKLDGTGFYLRMCSTACEFVLILYNTIIYYIWLRNVDNSVQYIENKNGIALTFQEWWSSEETTATAGSYSLYTSSDVDVVIDKAPRPALCTTWGGINMKTFDGLVFKYVNEQF